MKLDRETAGSMAGTSRDEKLARTFAAVEHKMQTAEATRLGSPYNLTGHQVVPSRLNGYLIATPPAPNARSENGPDVSDLEREAMAWLMRLWGCYDLDHFSGAIETSGTAANLSGIYLGREVLPDAVLLFGADAHSSLPRAAHILRVPTRQVASLPNGEMDMADFNAQLRALAGQPAIVALTCGTSMKGAHDNIAGALSALQDAGYGQDRRFVHVDGALNAMVLPFVQDVPSAIQPSFEKDIDSLSTCGHKMIGTPVPCGVLVVRKTRIGRTTQTLAQARSNDSTLIGAHTGQSVLAIWARLIGQGYGRFAIDAQRCVIRARRLASDLSALGAQVLCNPYSLTVVFPEPPERLLRRYQLPCANGLAHAIVMPSVTEAVLTQFLAEYAAWWSGRGRLP